MALLHPTRVRVAVLRGGPSNHYEHSLNSGSHVLKILRDNPTLYDSLDIFISKDGEWHLGGLVKEPHDALRHVDVAWNSLHGSFGEDGRIQRLLDSMHVPYTGSSAAVSALTLNKEMAKKYYADHALFTPRHELLREEDFNNEKLVFIFRNYMHPVMVKPANGGSGLGSKIAHTIHELEEGIKNAFNFSKKVLVEEFVRGKASTCAVVERARGNKIYTLIPTGDLKIEEKRRVEEAARTAHLALGLRHYSDSDFVVTKSGKIYILETNSSPLLHEGSHLHESLSNVGWQPAHFVDHVIGLALQKQMF